jgi:hypothetical protein
MQKMARPFGSTKLCHGHSFHSRKLPQFGPNYTSSHGVVEQMVFWVSLYESSVIAEGDEQLGPYEVQDQESVVLQ